MAVAGETGGYTVTLGDPVADREHVLALGRYLPEFSESRFRKYYERNPLGAPRFALARPAGGGPPIGMGALFPIRLRVDGQAVAAAVAGDFAVAPAHRVLGPALAIQRALLDGIEERFAFVVGVPNTGADPVFRRLGYRQLARRTLFVKVLRTERALRQRLPAWAARAVARLADPALAIVSPERRRPVPTLLSLERPRRFGPAFEPLCQEVERRSPVALERTPRTLDWKYEHDGEGPGPYRVLALSQRGHPVACLVFRDRENVRAIFDVLWLDGNDALEVLLAEAVRDARASGVGAVAISCYAWPEELGRALRRLGFLRRREGPRLVIHLPAGSPLEARLSDPRGWYFLGGDLDV